MSEKEIMEKLEAIDTPTISNVVATYPRSDDCLKLYDAWCARARQDQLSP